MKNQNSALLCAALFVGALGMFSAASCTKRELGAAAPVHVNYSESLDARLALEMARQGVAVWDGGPKWRSLCDATWQDLRDKAAGLDSAGMAQVVQDFIYTDVCVEFL